LPDNPLHKPYEQRHYLAECLDPVHIGTGEFQLGRVDNTIVREPGTNLPKIPGSSIGGVTRAYSAMVYDKYSWQRGDKHFSCAGKGGVGGIKHCGESTCQICTAFGFSIGTQSFQGLAQIGDARILFFPVYSCAGPVWITSPSALAGAGCVVDSDANSGTATDWHHIFNSVSDRFVPLTGPGESKFKGPLNLGWVYLDKSDFPPTVVGPSAWRIPATAKSLGALPFLAPVLRSLVLVDDRLFSAIVNDQLEVRTSVSISPETGAAEDGALFTAEAIPRACFLTFPITFWKPSNFRVPTGNGPGAEIAFTVSDIGKHVRAGLDLIEFLGIGGSNTRGMGRLRVMA
jgi:CRISPR-associated protein Cmr4